MPTINKSNIPVDMLVLVDTGMLVPVLDQVCDTGTAIKLGNQQFKYIEITNKNKLVVQYIKITTKNLTYLIVPKFGTYSKAMVPIVPVPIPVL